MTDNECKQIDELLDADGLTEWETGFIDCLASAVRHRAMSEKQSESLTNIWARVFVGSGQ